MNMISSCPLTYFHSNCRFRVSKFILFKNLPDKSRTNVYNSQKRQWLDSTFLRKKMCQYRSLMCKNGSQKLCMSFPHPFYTRVSAWYLLDTLWGKTSTKMLLWLICDENSICACYKRLVWSHNLFLINEQIIPCKKPDRLIAH